MAETTSPLKKRPDPELLNDIAVELGVHPSFIEKDWYAVRVIKAVAMFETERITPVFSGGTNLSKGYGLIKRFSEDVDFRAIFTKKPSRPQLRTYRKGLIAAINDLENLNVIEGSVKSRDGSQFFSFDIEYPQEFDAKSGLRAHLKLEFKARAPQLETENRTISSFVSELQNITAETSIQCVRPVEIAADKLSALIWRVLDRDRNTAHDDPAMIRHLHDLCALLQIVVGDKATFVRLSQNSFEEDLSRGAELIEKTLKKAAKSVLSTLKSDEEYRREYEGFVMGMSYTTQDERIDFDEALLSFDQLIELFED